MFLKSFRIKKINELLAVNKLTNNSAWLVTSCCGPDDVCRTSAGPHWYTGWFLWETGTCTQTNPYRVQWQTMEYYNKCFKGST
jgi:hypothetical protein